MKFYFCIILLLILFACDKSPNNPTYKECVIKLEEYTELVELSSKKGNARLIVMPVFQGRIATSTNTGISGNSLGWMNFETDPGKEGMTGNNLHGEERIWIGPLGGQFSFYYGQQKPINENDWSVPESFSARPFKLISEKSNAVILEKDIRLTNHIGTLLQMKLKRKIQLFENDEIERLLKIDIPESIKVVGYQTSHDLSNADTVSWKKETGLATPWSLSTFKGSNSSVTFVPIWKNNFVQPFTYLGKLKGDRLRNLGNVVWYKTDGKYRSKIGIPPELSKGILGNYQHETNTLRIIQFKQIKGDSLYFNSDVSEQINPYHGEAIAIYNHGPMDLSIGTENAFFEMETTAALKEVLPNESISHYHRVFQFTGERELLNKISQTAIGVDLDDCPFDFY